MRTNSIFALEDVREDPPQLGSDVTQEEVSSLREDIREGLAKTNVISKETDDITDAIGDIGVATMIQNKMASQESISLETVKICRITMESLRKKLHLGDQFIMPAMECFENHHEAAQARVLSLEGITDVIVSIWRAIKKAFATVWEKIKAFFHNLFGVFPRLKRYVESLKKRVEDARHQPKQDRFVDEETLKAFSIDGRFSPQNVNTILNAHIQTTSDISRLTTSVADIVKNLESSQQEIAGLSKAVDVAVGTLTDSKAISDIVTKTIAPIKEHFITHGIPSAILQALQVSLNLNSKRINERDVVGVSNAHYIDNQVIVITKNILPSTLEQQEVFELGVEIRTIENTPAKELSVLSGSEMHSILADCDRLIKMEETIKTYTEKLDNFSIRMNKLFTSIEETVSETGRNKHIAPNMSGLNDILNSIRIPINSLIAVFNTVYTTIPKFNINAVQKAARYVDLSLSYY